MNTSFINILANNLWSEADIVAHSRATIAQAVSPQRQTELQTIMLGHIAQMRLATNEELMEIGQVQALTLAASEANRQARIINAALAEVLAYEKDSTVLLSPLATEIYNLRHVPQTSSNST